MKSRVIKEGDLFLMTDESGDMSGDAGSVFGLYTKDTRFLSRLEIRINGKPPVLLSSSADRNYRSVIRLTNPHMEEQGRIVLWRESVEIERTRFIYDGVLYESAAFTNYYPKNIDFDFSLHLDSDFADMFVVRGYAKPPGGRKLAPLREPGRLRFRYAGSDGIARECRIEWKGRGMADEEGTVRFALSLQPKERSVISYRVIPVAGGQEPQVHEEAEALASLEASYQAWIGSTTNVRSDHPMYDKMFERGVADLRALMSDVGYGPFPVAGLPLFAVPFGRDSLIASLQMLAVNPETARGTLRTMAAMQGTKEDARRDEQPGKIMHEIRYGELANLGEIPFTPYYGTIDATPLFLVLAAEYYHWTADRKLLEELLPAIEQALLWIAKYGDADGDGFLEYYRESEGGLSNQGWKDSGDSLVHADGEYAQGPIALAEVQAYVYHAKTRLASILTELGRADLGGRLAVEAAQLRSRFEEAFWLEDEQFYAIALDKDKKPVRSVTSNPGQALLSGIISGERSRLVAKRLLEPDMFSGYGIRTMSVSSAGYNPMSYHNGSVWPHDNSLIVLGLKNSGFSREAARVMEGLVEAAGHYEFARLPELFCGYDRSAGHPIDYPVACSPQAWAAGTPLMFLQAMLGIRPDAIHRVIEFDPVLIRGMNELNVQRLRIGQGCLSLRVWREAGMDAPRIQVSMNTTGYEIRLPQVLERPIGHSSNA